MATERYVDLAVIGAGVMGLAHARAAAKRGLSVVVFDRHGLPVGASVRNFGLILTVGQAAGIMWERALKTREIWLTLADEVKFFIQRSGCMLIANRRDEWKVLTEFYTQSLAAGVQYRLLDPRETLVRLPMLQDKALRGALWSQYELRVEPRQALERIARYLEQVHGVHFVYGVQVQDVTLPRIETSAGTWEAELTIVCPGDDFQTLYPELFAAQNLERCKLQMLRTAPQPSGWRLPCPLLSGLSLLRYPAFAKCPSLPQLRRRLETDKAETLQYGINLIVCQGEEGDLLLGDSHEYSTTPSPFDSGRIEELLLKHASALVNIPNTRIVERWSGVYAYSNQQDHMILSPSPAVRLVLITSGIGMSVAFALADEVLTGLVGR